MQRAIKTELTASITRVGGTTTPEVLSRLESEISIQPTDGLRDLGNKSFGPLGKCMYCLAEEQLTREHIIPYGLAGTGGTFVALDASCEKCARITGKFERQVLRGPMRSVRVIRRLRSRSKHEFADEMIRLTFVPSSGGDPRPLELPLSQAPVLLPFPIFAAPPLSIAVHGIDLIGVATVGWGVTAEDLKSRFGTGTITISPPESKPVAFARLIAKIAHGSAVVLGHANRLKNPVGIADAILGNTEDIGAWVGTLPGPIKKYGGGLLHRVAFHEENGEMWAEVQLFADSETPTYYVRLGPVAG